MNINKVALELTARQISRRNHNVSNINKDLEDYFTTLQKEGWEEKDAILVIKGAFDDISSTLGKSLKMSSIDLQFIERWIIEKSKLINTDDRNIVTSGMIIGENKGNAVQKNYGVMNYIHENNYGVQSGSQNIQRKMVNINSNINFGSIGGNNKSTYNNVGNTISITLSDPNIQRISIKPTGEIEMQKHHLNDQPATPINNSIFPEELNTQQAKEYFSKAIEAGFMDDRFQWVKGTTKYQIALFAEICSEKLNIKHKWKPFETLWNVTHLAQTRRESKERFGRVDREKEITKIFE